MPMHHEIKKKLRRLIDKDSMLKPYEHIIMRRLARVVAVEHRLIRDEESLADFASGHEYFGLHFKDNEWVFREWAPNATSMYLVGDMTDWKEHRAFALERIKEDGIWQIRLKEHMLRHGDHYRLRMYWKGGAGDRIPAYARRVVQDPKTLIFTAQVWKPLTPYRWKNLPFTCDKSAPLIYEAHVGMAQEEERVGSYREFTEKVIPRISRAGYETIQLMSIQEHPYYGSFGYQVSNYFAASSRYGTPDDLKELIDTAHGLGLSVIMDLIHSHAASNEVEGLSRFDGTSYQYFHKGTRGLHPAWDSRCFDYGKPQVLHFLLSNCRFWLDEYHFDGFRFDGVTSMLFEHHGLGKIFTSYDQYFDESINEDALVYLTLANTLIHDIRDDTMTIAEEVSGMPCIAVPVSDGGTGFDFRFAMGIPDYWIQLTKDVPDECWHMGKLWFELNNRRAGEKTISYVESHDQALVGDQTLIFRLIGSDMYDGMRVHDKNLRIDRGIALHKIIRLITLATAGQGYMNFMGNEFGHPEWIDFPREGNEWSFKYARRQWHLSDDRMLKYHYLSKFDADMIDLARRFHLLEDDDARLIFEHDDDKVIAFERRSLLFVFNFHHDRSHVDYRFETPPGKYMVILDSDASEYGGHGRLDPHQNYFTVFESQKSRQVNTISLYLPTRTALVFARN